MTITDFLSHTDKPYLLSELLTQAKKKNEHNPAVLRRDDDYIQSCQDLQFSKTVQGCPIVIKDNILLEGTVSTFGSQIGIDYRAPYSATVSRKLENAGFLILGKTTMDEFAMGTTGENSPYPIPHNAIDDNLVAWWSSSGSAVAVAEHMVPVALWTDTGGSVRLPAAFNGIIWLKPTYGSVSRYGVQAMGSSFDQVWVFATTIEDTKTVFDIIKGKDDYDATTKDFQYKQTISDLQWVRIGLPQQYFAEGLDPAIKSSIESAITRYKEQGAVIIDLDIPLIDAGVSVYYTLVNSEVSSNLARFDGLKFGLQHDTRESSSHMDYLATIRGQGFGDEVKRRILLGAHILSASEYEWLYVKAMNIRTAVTKQFIQHFTNDVDVIMGPTTPFLPWELGKTNDDPVANYLADAYTVIANITGMPALSIPAWYVETDNKKLPVWLQLMGNHASEYDLFFIADQFLKAQQ